MMFRVGPATGIYPAAGSTGMRKSFEGLFGLVRDRLSCRPPSGHVFLFSSAQGNRLKLMFRDGSGLWVCAESRGFRSAGQGWTDGSRSGRADPSIMFSRPLSLLVGHADRDHFVTVPAIDSEMSIESEHLSCAVDFRQSNETRVRQ
jgi:hypothetical protein